MEHLLSPRDLAAAIGVSESSLKRWVDEGVIRATRTAGGHRRIPLRDALAYIRQTGAMLVQPDALGIADLAAGTRAAATADPERFLVDALVAGDLAASRGALLARYAAGEPIGPLLDGPVAAALHQVGDAWRHGAEGIYLEHRVTDTCLHCLNFLRSLLPPPKDNALLALGGAPAGDAYHIPTLMAAIVLAAEGWREINLGPNLPLEALAAAVREHKPALVWLSFTSAEATRTALRDLGALEKLAAKSGTQVILGGQAITAAAVSDRVHVHHLSSMQALGAFAGGIVASRRR